MTFRAFILLSGMTVMLSACINPVRAPHQTDLRLVSLQQATESVASHLFDGISKDSGVLGKLMKGGIAIDPMTDRYSQEQVLVSEEITKAIKAAGKSREINAISDLSVQSLRASQYLIQGTIGLEEHPADHTKRYHLQAIAVNVRSGEMVASADAWVADKELAYKALPEFKDSPVYVVNQQARSALKDTHSSKHFLMSVQAEALLNDAGHAYRNKQYAAAIGLFREAGLHAVDDQMLKVYAGLYMSHLRLGQSKEAEKAFEQLLALSFDQMDVLTLKILFKVGSEQFNGASTTQTEYKLWLKKIAEYLSANQRCLNVVGHGSHTGTAEYNEGLSLSRANYIKTVLESQMKAGKSSIKAEGRGFKENLVGSGTDDEQDMLDRRVEFKLPACGR